MPARQRRRIQEGSEHIFGFFQIDIAEHSGIEGPDINIQRTKSKLSDFVSDILERIYGAQKLNWAGDGGSFIFLIENPQNDYNEMVTSSFHVLHDLLFFNSMKGIHNLLQQDIVVRISCHEGRANYSRNLSVMHGVTINYFLKHERDIGCENMVTITGEVYNRLTSSYLKSLFQKVAPHEYTEHGNTVSRNLYRSEGRKTELIVSNPLVEDAMLSSIENSRLSIASDGSASDVKFWHTIADRQEHKRDVRALISASEQRVIITGISLLYIIRHCAADLLYSLNRKVSIGIVVSSDSKENIQYYSRYSNYLHDSLPLAHKMYHTFFNSLSKDQHQFFALYHTNVPLTHSIGLYDDSAFVSEFCIGYHSSECPSFSPALGSHTHNMVLQELKILLRESHCVCGSANDALIASLEVDK